MSERQQQLLYNKQLKQMLLGAGDLPEPAQHSVALVESSVQQYLRDIVTASSKPVTQRAAMQAVAESLRNRRSLAHCVRYFLALRDCRLSQRHQQQQLVEGGEGEGEGEEEGVEVEATEIEEGQQQQQQLPAFAAAYAARLQPQLEQLQRERQRRLARLNACTEGMRADSYQNFANCRRVTLLTKPCCYEMSDAAAAATVDADDAATDTVQQSEFKKFRRFIAPDGSAVTKEACRLLSYLAHQAVAELVDFVKQQRAERWPQKAQHLDASICATQGEMQAAIAHWRNCTN